jgi:transposase
MLYEGYCDKSFFETYIEQCLAPCLSKGDVVILDNAAFHQSQHAQASIEAKGAYILFLPPYSPDLNPIEHYWFTIKNYIRQHLDLASSLEDAASIAFKLSV